MRQQRAPTPSRDLTGQKFGKLTVVSWAEASHKVGQHYRWKCKCDCGNTIETRSNSLRRGRTKSCGCINGTYDFNNKLKQHKFTSELDKLKFRLLQKVIKTDSCWLWDCNKHAHHPNGYGHLKFNRTTINAHRASWLVHKGPIPDGMIVCHNCPGGDNPSCINPDHLFLGTPMDNTIDMVNKGRQQFHARLKYHSDSEIVKQIRKLWAEGVIIDDISSRLNIPKTSLTNVLKREGLRRQIQTKGKARHSKPDLSEYSGRNTHEF